VDAVVKIQNHNNMHR